VLKLLHELHPSAKLNLVLENRYMTPLSGTLLSSPQLHTLNIPVYITFSDDYCRYNELHFVKDCISANLTFTTLRFGATEVFKFCVDSTDRDRFLEWPTANEGPLNFDFRENDRFPLLQELSLEFDNYTLTREHCAMWAQVTSRDKLQRLDLGIGAPRHFFASLTGRAINLKSLKFWINPARANLGSETWDLQPMDKGIPILAKVIASITALRELDFGAHDLDEFNDTLKVMLDNAKGSLRRLTLTCQC
jgi:hypothetical protein